MLFVYLKTLVDSNNLGDKVFIVAGKIEEIDLPEKVDVIISEPMGYMLYNERMLETYLHAKKWLKPGGELCFYIYYILNKELNKINIKKSWLYNYCIVDINYL